MTSRRAFLATLAAVLPFGGALVKMMGKREASANPEPPYKVSTMIVGGSMFAYAELGERYRLNGVHGPGDHTLTSIQEDQDGRRRVELTGVSGSARGWMVRA